MKVYLAGPMRGIPEFNFPAFFAAGLQLQHAGHYVHNPAYEDDLAGFRWRRTTGNEDMTTLWGPSADPKTLKDVLAEDIEWILKHADAVAVLPGWEKSRGARAEVSAALAADIPVGFIDCFESDGIHDGGFVTEVPPMHELVDRRIEVSKDYRVLAPGNPFVALQDEVRVTSATGGQKGKKLARYDLIPTLPLRLLAEHYGKGAEKYHPVNGKDNWRNGYDFSLSYAAMQRHANAFWSGEDIDSETGDPHLVAVAWHAFTLLTFAADDDLRKRFDDRQDAA